MSSTPAPPPQPSTPAPSAGPQDAGPFADAYGGALARAPFPVIETDAALRVTRWNDAAEKLFGHARGDAVGRSLPELLPAAEEPEGWQRLLREPGAGATWSHARKGGGTATCAWSCEVV